MSTAPPRLVVHGDLYISSPTDEFVLRGDNISLTLSGPSLRSFLRLRRHASQAELPLCLTQVAKKFTGRSAFDLECWCRGRHIATVAPQPAGIRVTSRPKDILLVALRL